MRKAKTRPETPLRYMENARETLKRSPTEGNTYLDIKYVKSACGTAYLGVLRAIDEYLLKRGLNEWQLPQSIEGYRDAVKRHLSVRNGKLAREFEMLYKALHMAGYYRGLLQNTEMVKDALRAAEDFIKKVRA